MTTAKEIQELPIRKYKTELLPKYLIRNKYGLETYKLTWTQILSILVEENEIQKKLLTKELRKRNPYKDDKYEQIQNRGLKNIAWNTCCDELEKMEKGE